MLLTASIALDYTVEFADGEMEGIVAEFYDFAGRHRKPALTPPNEWNAEQRRTGRRWSRAEDTAGSSE
jgi:hypothetical protein